MYTLFLSPAGFGDPPLTVKSSPPRTTDLPSILAKPRIKLAGVKDLSSPFSLVSISPAISPCSWKDPLSMSLSIRSLRVNLPLAC